MVAFNISLRFQPSGWFLGIIAELNERFSDWTDGSYDWAAQTTDFLHNPVELPQFDETLFETPLSKRAVNDVLHLAVAILSGDFMLVRNYIQHIRFAFVIGYPRSGGSYLTKELLRSIGLDHTRVSEALAHDGFPELREIWYDIEGDRPYYHLQAAMFQVAEFLVVSNLYYQLKTPRHASGLWFSPKKFHKIINWGGSFKMLLGQGRADYFVTLRHPLPTAISVAEKSGGMPADHMFPAMQPRSAIERWVLNDLMLLGWTMPEITQLSYFDAICASWSSFYGRMATSGLFLGDRSEIRLVPYGKDSLEGVVRDFRVRLDNTDAPEPVMIHTKAAEYPMWQEKGDQAVAAMAGHWRALGLPFPDLGQD
ncbi:MAG: hypothetical protein GC146_11575 [Limimaricola sp.]|uniref:hypothetical protein n=1 Tax=Limimaricola sp. TaxID=2211665 RepID=UPI001DC97CC2|nr:hypothetical protein [Limimaricola sp.]MBI1417853.1 hypothetical protein [Limimaricola sp.]